MASCRDGGCLILFTAESFGRKQTHMDSLGRKQFISAGNKRLRTVLAEAKYDRQSQQETKTGGLVYTLCYMFMDKQCTVSEFFFFPFQTNFKHEGHRVRWL